jgi:C4-type Zn-finger protein
MQVTENNNTINVACPSCKSKMTIAREDIEYHYHMGHASYYFYLCGACDEKIRVDFCMPASWRRVTEEKKEAAMGGDYDD